MTAKTDNEQNHTNRYKYLLALSALGVVYGDIGTSPLYALKEAFHQGHNIGLSENNIFGILFIWIAKKKI